MKKTVLPFLILIAQQGFSQECKPTDIEKLTADGKIISQLKFEYDKNQNLIHKTSTSFMYKQALVTEEKNTYNKENKLLKTQNLTNQKPVSSSEFEYDEKGELASKKEFIGNVNSSFEGKNGQISYFDNGEIASIRKQTKTKEKEVNSVSDAKNNLISEETKEFDQKGNLKNYNSFEAKAKMNRTIKYIYNEKDQKIGEVHFYNENESMRIDYTYSNDLLTSTKASRPDGSEPYKIEYIYKDNLLTEEIIYSFGKIDSKISRTYDTQKKLIQEISRNAENQVITYTNYKYECN